MRTLCGTIIAAVAVMLSGAAFCAVGEDEKCPVSANVRGRENIEWSRSYAYGLTDETRDLPRVLLIGDSICSGYQEGVRERLKGKMNVTYWVSSYCVTSPAYLPLLSIYLDEAKYDVIHFNNGLHSLETPTDAWAKGFKAALELVRKKQPDAKLVWCSSTPLANGTKTAKCRELNAAAARVVTELGGIATDDLFALCDPLDRATNWCDEYHFHSGARAKQADQVAGSVLVALSKVMLSANGVVVDGKVCRETGRWNMFERRLGMFVHWGIYSVGEWHEQEHLRKGMSRADYEKFAGRLTAEKFNADDFVAVAKSAGAEYIVFTSKHHDGFCMWDTATTDYKVTNTPAKRDIIGELAAACRRNGVKLGFYYSNPDWHHPNAHNEKSTHQIPMEPGDVPDMDKYMAYVKAQVTELLTKYGEIACFFWDIPTNIDRPEMDALVRRLQPGIMVNDRGWGNKATCDYSTPERDYKWDLSNGRHIESCDSVGVQSWGYRADEDYHTHGYLTRNIDRYLSTGANFLLNVGPKADGTIPDEARAIMADVGKWYGKVRDSFRNVKTVTDLKLAIAPNAVVTRRDDTLFVHFPTGLDATGLDLRPLTVMPERATLLNTGKALNARVEFMPWNAGRFDRETLHVWGIPADDLANECVVIRLDFAPGALRDL